MKKKKTGFSTVMVGFILLCAVISACGGSPPPVFQPDELDAAIRETSDYLNNQTLKFSVL